MQVAAFRETGPLQPPGLLRSLNTLDAAALVVSNIIGVGIFTTPGVVAAMAPQPAVMLALWAFGGVLAIAGALAYAELAALRPYAGGEYVYIHEAFGPLAGFLSGWTSFIAGFSGAIAAGAVGAASYLGALIPRWGDAQPWFTISVARIHWGPSPRGLVALFLIFALSLIHVRGLGPGRAVQNILAGLSFLTLIALIAAGFSSPKLSSALLSSRYGELRWTACVLALVPVMFTYSGWNAATYVAEEIRNPERNIRRALLLATGMIIALYLGLNALYVCALGPKLAGTVGAGSATATALFGARAARLMTVLMIVALAGSVSAMIIAGPRVYFAMARDRVFAAPLARVHSRYHTPAAAILCQALWSGILVLTGTFEQLLLYTGMAVVLFSGLAVLALLVLRARIGSTSRSSPSAGRLAPWLFVAACVLMIASGAVEHPGASAVGFLLIAGGMPVYFWFRKKTNTAGQEGPFWRGH